MKLSRRSAVAERGADGDTHSPACQLPSPRIASAWTLVIRSRFSVSAKLAESWASCEWSWAYTKVDLVFCDLGPIFETECYEGRTHGLSGTQTGAREI